MSFHFKASKCRSCKSKHIEFSVRPNNGSMKGISGLMECMDCGRKSALTVNHNSYEDATKRAIELWNRKN
jgi:hypothetical protein